VKRLFLIFAIMVLFVSNSSAMQNNIRNEMVLKINTALKILKNKKEDNSVKANKIFKIFNKMFDYNLMARLSLGRSHWFAAKDIQRKKFVKEFISLLKESFMEKLKLYNNQKMIVKNFNKSRKNRAKLVTYIVGEKNSIKVVYKFYKSQKRAWIIYDVIIAGVSIVQSYREQFNDLLNNMDFKQFLNKINKINTNNNNA